ncbi:MAG: hypothetical protein ACKO32_12040 [Planctomycetia bacterium]
MRALLALSLVMLGGGERWTGLHESGRVFRREYTRVSKIEMQDAYVRANGEEKHVESPGVSSQEQNLLRVEDHVVAAPAGELLALERRFVEVTRTLQTTQPDKDGRQQSRELKENGALEGRTVRFERAGPSEEFAAKLLDKEGPREDLPRLDVDMGALGILPESAPQIDGTWKVPAEKFRVALLRPGGRLRWPLPAGAPAAEERLSDGLWDSMEGELELRFAERVEREGQPCARIEWKGNLGFSAQTERAEGESGAERYRREGKGTLEGWLEWNLEAGYTLAFEGTMELELTATEWGQFKTKGDPIPIEREFVSKQVEKLAYKAERVAR